MSDALRGLALGLALLLGQALVVALLPVALRPDLMLVFALAMGLRARATESLALAFGLGFAVDALSGSPPGLFAGLRGTAAALTRLLDRALNLRAPAPWGTYVAAYAVLDGALTGLALWTLTPEVALPVETLAARIPAVALVTGLVAAPLLPVFRRFEGDTGREPGLLLGGRGRRALP